MLKLSFFPRTRSSRRTSVQANNESETNEAKNSKSEKETKKSTTSDETIDISDDETPSRQPSSFIPAESPENEPDEWLPKNKSVRKLFGKDESCYIMDAKNAGNIGRFLNHSCSPNVFVQNVFVDTHDLRFPWVAFFALSHIHAGTELTWNYHYDVGSVPGKVLYCQCGSQECRGRLL